MTYYDEDGNERTLFWMVKNRPGWAQSRLAFYAKHFCDKRMLVGEVEKALKIVGPVAKMVGLTEDDTRNVINYIDGMSLRGISGNDAGMALRVWLKNKTPQ